MGLVSSDGQSLVKDLLVPIVMIAGRMLCEIKILIMLRSHNVRICPVASATTLAWLRPEHLAGYNFPQLVVWVLARF